MSANLTTPTPQAMAPTAAGRPFAQSQATVPGLPKLGARAKGLMRQWEFKHSPNRWGYSDERGGWYPRLAMHSPMVGASGLTNTGGIDKVLAQLAIDGWQIIAIGDARLEKFSHYMLQHQVQGGGPQYIPMWVIPVVLGGKVRWEVDTAMYTEFLQLLVTAGIVEPPHPLVKRDLILRQEEGVRRSERDVLNNQGNSLYTSRLERQTAKLARMRGEDSAVPVAEARELAKIAARRGAESAQARVAELEEAPPPAPEKRGPGRPREDGT